MIMAIYFDAQTLGFDLVESSNSAVPESAVEITPAQYAELFAGQGIGKVISATANGYPVLVDPVATSEVLLVSIERTWRSKALEATQWLVLRDSEELEVGEGTTLSSAEFKALLAYRQSLRDWPTAPDFPDADYRPVMPGWLDDLLRKNS
ncbi:hypothetical protein PMI30_03163 [Pseudomonas sp. GM50]|nr:hypothetical protein PMI30_03163 [Pseudomonas sp. GM50]